MTNLRTISGAAVWAMLACVLTYGAFEPIDLRSRSAPAVDMADRCGGNPSERCPDARL